MSPTPDKVVDPVKAADAIKVQDAEFTYFLFHDEPGEAKIALAYIADKYPNSLAKRVVELRVDRLTDKHNVIVLVRGRDPRKSVTPLINRAKNEYGTYSLVNTDPETLKHEIAESEPIACGQFWNKLAGWEGGDGELDIASFLQRVGELANPLRVYWHPESRPGILQLKTI